MPKALNSESVRVNLQFTADTAQAKKELKQLQDTLRSLTTNPAGGQTLSKEMAEASRYAAELSVHLKKATNPNSGMLDFSRLNESIKKSGMSLSAYGDKLLSLGPQGKQAFSQLATAVAQSEIPIRRINGALAQMGTVLKNTIRWQLSSTAIHAFSGAIQTAYNYAKDLNESLNNIRIVTGYNIDQMERFAATANKAARQLSTSTLDYTNAALIYYQQGLSDREVEARTNVTAKMANVTKQSAEEVSNQLTAIWNNYAKGSENLEYFADVITALGAATASSSKEISTGLEKFAAIGETVGLSYEYATAALATVTATTRQSAEVVGNSFKTLFSRIQGLKLGETQDDGTDLNKYSAALLSVGVNIKDASGELKDMDVILEETAAKWQHLGREQQMALAQTVGGVRQYTQFIALMDNWDFMQKNLQTAYGSSGSLQKQQDIYAEGWEAAAKRVKAAWEDVYKSLINDEFFIDLLNFVEKAVTGFKNLIGTMGGIPGILTTIGSLVMTIFGKQMAEGLTNMTYSLQSLTAAGRQKMMNERQSELNTMGFALNKFSNNTSASDEVWASSLRNQIYLQNELTQNVDRLSETERLITTSLQDQYRARSQLAVKAAEEADQAKRAADADLDRQRREANTPGFTSAYVNYKNAYKNHAELLNMRNNVPFAQSFNSIPDKITSEQVQKLQQYAISFRDKYTSIFNSVMKSSDAKMNMNKFLTLDPKDFKLDSKGFKVMIQSVANSLTAGLGQAVDQSSAELVGLGEAAENAGVNLQQLEQITDAEMASSQKAAQVNQELALTYNLIGEYIEVAKLKTMTWQEQLVSFGQVAMSAGMVFNALNGIINTWKNEDLTFGEKFFSSLMSAGMILPMLISGLKALKASMTSIRIEEILTTEAASHGLTIEETKKGIAAARLLLKGEELSEDQTRILTEMGILGAEKAQEGQLSKNVLLQKLFNAETWKNPYLIAGAAILAIIVGIALALKQAAEAEKERLQAQREADEKTLTNASERVDAIKSESEELEQLTKTVKQSIAAYDESEGSKQRIFDATKSLLDAYDVEGASLLLLQGNYKELNRLLDENIEKKRQAAISEIEGKLADTSRYQGAKLSSIERLYSSASTTERSAALTLRHNVYEGLSDKDKQYLLQDKNSYLKINFQDNLDAEGIVNTYEALERYKNALLKAGAAINDKDIVAINENLQNLDTYYKEIKKEQSELINIKDESIGYNTLKNTEVSINNVSDALARLTKNYNQTSASTEEAESKARLYLKTQADWNEAFTTYDAIQQKRKSGQGGTLEEKDLIELYNKLQTDAERMIFFQLAFKAGASEQEILDAIRTGSVGIEMELHTANASALAEATNNFKKNMSVQETKDWAKKYGVSFGDENSLIGMELRDFMGMSDTQKQAYLSNRTLTEQNLAYDKAKQYYKENKNEDDIAEKTKLLTRRSELENLRNTTTDASLMQGINEALVYVNAQLDQVETRLTEAENNILEGDARKLLEFTSALEKAKDLKLGDTISQDEFNNLTDGIDKSLEQYFVPNNDGTWTLVVSQVDLKEGIQDALDKQEGPLSKEQQTSLINTASNYNELIQLQGKNNIESDIAIGKIQTLASKYEDCTDEVRIYQKALKESGKGSTEANKAYTNLVNSIKRNEFKELGKSFSSVLKNLDKLKDYEKIDTFKEISKQLKEFYNIASDDTRMDENWVLTHLDWIKDLFNGTKEESDVAANKIKQDIYSVEELTLEALTEIKNGNLDATVKVNLDGEEVELEAQAIKDVLDLLDDSNIELLATGKADFSELLTELSRTEVGAKAVANLLAELGQSHLNVNVSGNDVKMPGEHLGGGGMQFEWEDEIAAIENALANLDGKKLSVTGYVPASGNGGVKAVDSSGGGGGSKAQNYKKEEYRYESQTEKINDLEKALNRISEAKDRAFGYKRVNLINQEIAALDKEIAAQEELIGQVKDYINIDKNRLLNGEENAFSLVLKDAQQATWHSAKSVAAMLAESGTGVSLAYDEFGNIANIEAIKTALNQWYNLQVDKYNTGKNEDEWAIAQEQHKWAMNALQQYGDSVNKLAEEEDKLQEEKYQKQDYYAEQLNTRIEHRIQLEKNELALITSSLTLLNGSLFKGVEIFNLMRDQLSKSTVNASELREDYEKWLALKDDISDEEYRAGLQQVFDSSGEAIEDLMSQINDLSNYYSDFIGKFDNMMKFETKKFDILIEELEYYNELASLTGHEKDYNSMLKVLDSEKEVVSKRLEVNKALQTEYQSDYDKIIAQYDKALKDRDTEMIDFLRPSVEAAKNLLDETNSQIREDIKELAELAQKEFSTALDKIYYESEQKLTNNLGFDLLSQTMDLASKQADEYLTKTNQIYETNQMLRDIANDINKTNNKYAKTQLNNFSKEIAALQSKKELSHYELEDAKARYEVLKAQIALEEAQNAKSTVRLQRDNEGNYGYVYTADRDKIKKAEDDLAKASNDRYNLALKTQQDYLRKFYDTEREANEALRKLDEDLAAGRITDENVYRTKKQEIIEYYGHILKSYEQTNTQALQVMNETAAQHINDSWTNTFGADGYGLIGKSQEWEKQSTEDAALVQTALETLADSLSAPGGPIEEYNNLSTAADNATVKAEKLRKELVDEFLPWVDSIKDGVIDIAAGYDGLYDSIHKTLEELQLLNKEMGKEAGEIRESGLATYTAYAEDGSTYTIHSEKGNRFIEDSTQKELTGGDNSHWVRNDNGSVSIFKNGKEYRYNGTWDKVEEIENKNIQTADTPIPSPQSSVGYSESDVLSAYRAFNSGQRLLGSYSGEPYYAALYALMEATYQGSGKFISSDVQKAWDIIKHSYGFASGGYTGEWGTFGKLAMLHEKELVLNADDTRNMLAAVQLVREISNAIDLQAQATGASSSISTSGLQSLGQTVEQVVTIHAEFPNATNHSEIEQAFDNLINRASQYANRY